MKDILIEGHRITTTDAIADAVIRYAQLLAREKRSDVVEFPGVHEGMPSQCALMLAGRSSFAVVSVDGVFGGTLEGDEEAHQEIQRRIETFR